MHEDRYEQGRRARGDGRRRGGGREERQPFREPGDFRDRPPGDFGDRPDWQQPRFLGYGGRGRSAFGPYEQEDAWDAGGAAEHLGFAHGSRSGPHVGKGPKGYRRSDERILEDVCHVLEQHPRIDASEIEVSCHEGEITLRGGVDSRHTRRLAEEVIEDLPGVRDVHNELRAQRGGPEQRQHGASEPGGGRFAPR